MARAARAKPGSSSHAAGVDVKMESLASFVRHMEPAEIHAFLRALFPYMDEEEREDLYGALILEQRGRVSGGRPAAEVFAELDQAKGLTR